MTTGGRAERRAAPRPRVRLDGLAPRRLSHWRWRLAHWRWRLAGAALVLAYVIQDAAGLRWEWLAQLQTIDAYKYATGACMAVYVGWQWYLFLARFRGAGVRRLLVLHQRSGVFAPVLFYSHSVQIGYGYLAVLSWILLANTLVGAANPRGTTIRRRAYTASWLAAHVLLAVLLVILGLFHAYIAVYYS